MDPVSQTGTIDFQFGGESFKTYYQVFGDLGGSKYPPLVLLHGGPGIPHNYLLPFEELTRLYGIPVITYDQIGCGNSSQLQEKPPSFWTMDLFMDELENLLRHFKIIDNFSLYGHSWGSMLAEWYAGARQPAGLKKLILADGIARMQDWTASNIQLLGTLPQEVQDGMNAYELSEKAASQEFRDAIAKWKQTNEIDEQYSDLIPIYKGYYECLPQFQACYVCRVAFPAVLGEAFMNCGPYPNVSDKLWGPFYLRVGPHLADWDVTHLLPNIGVPTLVYHGKFDQAQDFVVDPLVKLIPNSKKITFMESAHVPHLEREKDLVYKEIATFLKEE